MQNNICTLKEGKKAYTKRKKEREDWIRGLGGGGRTRKLNVL